MESHPAPFGVLLLAGGRSSRMGQDKAALSFHGIPLLTHMRQIAEKAGASTILVGGGPTADLLDPLPHAGPVASLCALADYTAGQPRGAATPAKWVTIPVDMPLLSPHMLTRLAGLPVHAAYFDQQPLPLMLTLDDRSRGVLARMKAKLRAGESVAIWRTLELLHGASITPTEAERDALVNANTPDEWQALLATPRKETP